MIFPPRTTHGATAPLLALCFTLDLDPHIVSSLHDDDDETVFKQGGPFTRKTGIQRGALSMNYYKLYLVVVVVQVSIGLTRWRLPPGIHISATVGSALPSILSKGSAHGRLFFLISLSAGGIQPCQ